MMVFNSIAMHGPQNRRAGAAVPRGTAFLGAGEVPLIAQVFQDREISLAVFNPDRFLV